MAFNDVNIIKSASGLGTPLEGTDFISGILFYSGATLPTGFTSTTRNQVVFSVADAVNLGITNTSLGETKSTATYLVTTKFTTGDKFKLTCNTIASTSPIIADALAGIITLCDYTADATAATNTTTSATAIAAAINALTYLHGFTATSATATVTITAAPGQGIFLNTGTPYVKTETGAILGTLTQNVVPGVASDIDILYYHVSEFFRRQPKGKLYIGIYATADVGTFANMADLQNYATGSIRQLFIYQKSAVFSTAQVNAIQAQNTSLEAIRIPYWSVILGGEISGTADLTGYAVNLKALTAPQVTVTIAQDGAAKGFKLYKATGKSITNGGEALGTLSLSAVNNNWAWIGKFQVASSELDTLAFANGQLWTALSNGAQTNLDTLGFAILRKVQGLNGSYHNNPWTCITSANDYSRINRNRTIYKAIESVRAILLPETGGDVKVNANGTLTLDKIGYYKGLGQQALATMVSDNELSAYNIIINPNQNIVSTGILVVTVELLPIGSADFITVNIGFVTQLSSS